MWCIEVTEIEIQNKVIVKERSKNRVIIKGASLVHCQSITDYDCDIGQRFFTMMKALLPGNTLFKFSIIEVDITNNEDVIIPIRLLS